MVTSVFLAVLFWLYCIATSNPLFRWHRALFPERNNLVPQLLGPGMVQSFFQSAFGIDERLRPITYRSTIVTFSRTSLIAEINPGPYILEIVPVMIISLSFCNVSVA